MELAELKELIELIAEKGFAEFELEREDFRLRISRFKEVSAHTVQSAQIPLAQAVEQAQSNMNIVSPSPAATSAQPSAQPEAPSPESQLLVIKSPMVGTFYRAPSPDADPFVEVGTRVERNTVVCIIEAMKLMNEVVAEMTGEVAKIYVENGQPVEYGQPLFGVKP